MNFGPLFGSKRNYFGNRRKLRNLFGTKLQAITGIFFRRLWINLISVSSMAVFFLVSFIPLIIFLTKGLSSLIPSLKKALITYCTCLLFSFLGSSHGQEQLDNVSELFFSSATLGTYEVHLVSLLDYR